MKAYLIVVAALMVGSVFLELHLTAYYQPVVEDLASTIVSEGKLYFMYHHNVGLVPTLNGMSLDCHLYFGGSAGRCPDSVQHLADGTRVTVSITQVFATYYLRSVPMAITVRGEQVYAITPEQFIRDYMRRSRRSLPLFPFLLLGLLVLAPLASEDFRNAFLRLFRD